MICLQARPNLSANVASSWILGFNLQGFQQACPHPFPIFRFLTLLVFTIFELEIKYSTTSLEYRSGNEDCVHMRHVLYIQCLYRHSARCPVLRYYCTVTKWSECIIYPVE